MDLDWEGFRIKRLFSFLLTLCLLTGAPAMAMDLPKPSADAYVLDTAGVLEEETEGIIVFSNDLLREKTGAEIAVVAIASTGDYPIEDYAKALFNDWGIGDEKKQNGILVLLAIEDDNYYLLPGTGLDLELSAGTLGYLVDLYLEPQFAAGAYDDGVYQVFCAIFEKVCEISGVTLSVNDGIAAYREYAGSLSKTEWEEPSQTKAKDTSSSEGGSGRLIAFLLIVVALSLIFRRRPKSGTRSSGTRIYFGHPTSGHWTRSHTRNWSSGAGSSHRSSFGGSMGRSGGTRSGGFGGGRSFGGGGTRGGGVGRGK